MVSTPMQSQANYYIGESGNINRELLSMTGTGWESPPLTKKAWAVIHSSKFSVEKNGIATGDTVLLISDRSYIPLDPNGAMTQEDKERLASLKDIARMRHAAERHDAGHYQDPQDTVPQNIVLGCFVISGLAVALYFIGQFIG